jgi:hypothetical protein
MSEQHSNKPRRLLCFLRIMAPILHYAACQSVGSFIVVGHRHFWHLQLLYDLESVSCWAFCSWARCLLLYAATFRMCVMSSLLYLEGSFFGLRWSISTILRPLADVNLHYTVSDTKGFTFRGQRSRQTLCHGSSPSLSSHRLEATPQALWLSCLRYH